MLFRQKGRQSPVPRLDLAAVYVYGTPMLAAGHRLQ